MALPPILDGRLRIPVIAAPLFIISHPPLVIAQAKAGVVGSFPALNARPAEQLDEWLCEIEEALAAHDRDHPERPAAPFAVNQIVHKSNTRLEHDLAACVKHKVPIVITSLGARPELNDAVHSYGGIVLHDIINDRFARKAIEKGADGLIAVAAGAGGHAGTLSPFALVQEIREWFDGPLFLSGAIANGRAVLAAHMLRLIEKYEMVADIILRRAENWEGWAHNSKRHTSVVAPPGSAKTTLLQSFYEWLIGRASLVWGDGWADMIHIGHVSASADQASGVSFAVRDTIQGNEKYRLVFPRVRPHKDKFAEKEWRVEGCTGKDPTFRAVGVHGPLLG
ncbi:hypothetical protein LCGC14_0288410, partial [marine sediment metagenome]